MLGGYFAWRFLVLFFRVFLVVAALIFLIDFLENIRRFSTEENGTFIAAKLALLHVPSLISEVLTIIILLAGLAFSISLARSSEFVISRAVGRSALRSLAITFATVLALGWITVLIFDPIAARLKAERDTQRQSYIAPSTQNVAVLGGEYWMRQNSALGQMILQAQTAAQNGRQLRDVTLLDFDPDGIVKFRYFARQAYLTNGQLVLVDGRRWPVDTSIENPQENSEDFTVLRFETTLTPALIIEGFPPPEALSLYDLPGFARQLEQSGFSALAYALTFQTRLARPLLFLAMFAFGVVFTLQTARLGNLGRSSMAALAIGFGVHFVQSFVTTLGAANQVPILIAAWFPALAALLLAWSIFLFFEDG